MVLSNINLNNKGNLLKNYTILKTIGKGAYGVVYLSEKIDNLSN